MSGLLPQLNSQVGEALRVVATYDPDGYTLVSVRSDLDADRTHGRVGLIYTNLIAPEHSSEPALNRDLGAQQATVYVREQALFIHLPADDLRGVLIGVDPSFSENLVDLINTCRGRFKDRQDQFDELVSPKSSI